MPIPDSMRLMFREASRRFLAHGVVAITGRLGDAAVDPDAPAGVVDVLDVALRDVFDARAIIRDVHPDQDVHLWWDAQRIHDLAHAIKVSDGEVIDLGNNSEPEYRRF